MRWLEYDIILNLYVLPSSMGLEVETNKFQQKHGIVSHTTRPLFERVIINIVNPYILHMFVHRPLQGQKNYPLVIDHLIIQGLIIYPSLNILLKKRSKLSGLSVQTLVALALVSSCS